MIRALYSTQDGQLHIGLSVDGFAPAVADASGLLWIDLTGEPPEVCEPILRGTFGFHPLAVDDALQESHVPKVDDWGSYLYLVLHALEFDGRGRGQMHTQELDLFLGRNFLVTYHEKPIPAIDHAWELCQRDARHLRKGADHLLYRLADELVASYMPVVEEIDEKLDRIEDQLFERPTQAAVEQLFALKRALLHMRRILAPEREVLNKLARDDYATIDAESRIFFRDVYDHMVRLHDLNESLRELVGGAVETYLSVVNNRMNEIMKTLTLITTLFMPLSFVVGFFGMNFFLPVVSLDIWTGMPAFAITLAILMLTPVGMYLWMRRRAWMQPRHKKRSPACLPPPSQHRNRAWQ